MSAAAEANLLEETLDRLFGERCGPEQRQAAEAEGWAGECWDALSDAGLAWVGVPESAGGSGGDVGDACTVLRVAGRHAVPLPLAEGVLLGGWLLAKAGLQLPDGPISVAVPRAADRLEFEAGADGEDGTDGAHGAHGKVTGTLTRVPWGARVAAVVGLARTGTSGDAPRVVVLDPAEASVRPGHNVAGEPRDALTWDGAVPSQVGSLEPEDLGPELTLRGALSRALLMAGAMEAVADLTVEYAAERQQFGRPIASFQAVGQRLVRLSSEAEAGILATEVAARRFAQSGSDAGFEVAVAKASAARAASEVATHAHQVHGAIGMTREYALHHFTRRLWTWRQEWGSEAHWSRWVGERVTAAGAEALWPRVATGLVAVP
jgi:acyl-CoA dehydrogenase